MKKIILGLIALSSVSVFADSEPNHFSYTVQAGDRVILLESTDNDHSVQVSIWDLEKKCNELSGRLLSQPKCSLACYQICKY